MVASEMLNLDETMNKVAEDSYEATSALHRLRTNSITRWTLPIPAGLKREWAGLETRRRFLGRSGKVLGLGSAGQPVRRMRPCAAGLRDASYASSAAEARNNLGLPHFAPKAKRAIYLFMSGGPPQIDLLDYKPNLASQFNKDMPDSVRGNQQLTGMTAGQARFPIAPSHWAFKQYGQTGTWVSDLLPYTARMVDDLTIIKSMNTDAINHEPAIMLMNTGNMNAGKPCLGAWLAYGLGSMNDNLPTFIVLQTKTNPKENNQPVSSRLVEQRISFFGICRSRPAVGRRSGALSCRSRGRGSRCAPQDARCRGADQSPDAGRNRRSGNQRAHCAVRNGVPHAIVGSGAC